MARWLHEIERTSPQPRLISSGSLSSHPFSSTAQSPMRIASAASWRKDVGRASSDHFITFLAFEFAWCLASAPERCWRGSINTFRQTSALTLITLNFLRLASLSHTSPLGPPPSTTIVVFGGISFKRECTPCFRRAGLPKLLERYHLSLPSDP